MKKLVHPLFGGTVGVLSASTVLLALSPILPTGPVTAQVVPGASDETQKRHQRSLMQYRARAMAQIQEQLRDWRVTWQAGDAEELTRYYLPQASLVLPGRPLVRGREDIRRNLEEVLPTMQGLLTGITDFDVGGSVAVLMGRYLHTATGSPGENHEGIVFTSFRNVDGEWMIRTQVFRPSPSD